MDSGAHPPEQPKGAAYATSAEAPPPPPPRPPSEAEQSKVWPSQQLRDAHLKHTKRQLKMFRIGSDDARAALAESMQTDDEALRLWAIDAPSFRHNSQPKQYFAASVLTLEKMYWANDLDPRARHVYEMLTSDRPCWPYFVRTPPRRRVKR